MLIKIYKKKNIKWYKNIKIILKIRIEIEVRGQNIINKNWKINKKFCKKIVKI